MRYPYVSSVYVKISTHTLTWSVTIMDHMPTVSRRISTHTLTWSVTGDVLYLTYSNGDFNSHAHVERDRLRRCQEEAYDDFNSHAHVERDVLQRHGFHTVHHFNSHAHVERDLSDRPHNALLQEFQLTRSRGA